MFGGNIHILEQLVTTKRAGFERRVFKKVTGSNSVGASAQARYDQLY